MVRMMMVSALVLAGFTSLASGQEKAAADPREELVYDGKSFAWWQKFPRTELKPDRRIDAVRAMAAFGSRAYAREATKVIVDLLKEYDSDLDAQSFDVNAPEKGTADMRVMCEVFYALRKIGKKGAAELVAALDHKAVRVVAQNLQKRSDYGIEKDAVPVLIRWIRSKDEEARTLAITMLAANPFKDAIIAALEKEKCEQEFVEVLRKRVEKNLDGIDESSAVKLLGVLGPRARAAVPVLVRLALVEVINNPAPDALSQIKPSPAERIPGLLTALKDGPLRREAAEVLGSMGTDAHGVIGEILTEIKKPIREPSPAGDADVKAERLALLQAYVKIAGNREALPVVTELLDKNQLPQIERQLVQVYRKLENDPKRMTKMLVKSLQRLANMKKEPEPPITRRFLPSVSVETGEVQTTFTDELVILLGEQGADAGSAVPLLMKTLEQSELMKTLERSDYIIQLRIYNTQLRIVRTLGKIGPSATAALPQLRKLLQSDGSDLRQAAAEAIEAITKK